MAGFRDFQTGEVLTSANVNDFLAKQAVMKFADATARDTALGTAVGGGNALREGMTAYLDDTNRVQYYRGTSWTNLATELDFGLIDVKNVTFTGTQSASVAAGGLMDVTDLSISHAVVKASNRLIISAYVGVAATSVGFYQPGIVVSDDGTPIGVGDGAGDRGRIGAGGNTTPETSGTIIGQVVVSPSVTFVYTPGDTNSHTYKVSLRNLRASTATLYANRSEADTNSEVTPRGSSALVIQEIDV